jgi:hypothetical protein
MRLSRNQGQSALARIRGRILWKFVQIRGTPKPCDLAKEPDFSRQREIDSAITTVGDSPMDDPTQVDNAQGGGFGETRANSAATVDPALVSGLGLNDLVDLDRPAESVPTTGSMGLADLTRLDEIVGPASTPGTGPSSSVSPLDETPLVDLDSTSPGTNVELANDSQGLVTTIRSCTGILAQIQSPELKRLAVIWSQVIRNRERWSKPGGPGDELVSASREVFKSMGMTEEQLSAIATARLIEVSAPYVGADDGWESRVFPWEAMLSAATKPIRGDDTLWVLRHLERVKSDARTLADAKLLYVQSLPRALREWNFDVEQQRVLTNLSLLEARTAINTPRAALADLIKRECAGVIHFAGFDTWQATSLLNLPSPKIRRDGLMICGESGEPEQVDADGLRQLLTGPERRPWLVSLNVYNSAARLAPLAVAGGAESAVGFQDLIDDDLAELFFARMYQAIRPPVPQLSVFNAFLQAQDFLRLRAHRLTGSGIALWRDQPLAEKDIESLPPKLMSEISGATEIGSAPPEVISGRSTTRAETTASETVVKGTRGSTKRKSTRTDPNVRGTGGRRGNEGSGTGDGGRAPSTEKWQLGTMVIKPYDKLNYSMLHNKSAIFERFVLYREGELSGPFGHATVSAELYLGVPSPCSWEKTFDVSNDLEHLLHSEICLPLVSELQRSLRFTLFTNLKVRIEYNERSFYWTFPVELLAIDEWRDDEMARIWLPSFVMPGDSVVPQIIDAAQRYLTTLVDEADAGFDAYQRIGQIVSNRPLTSREVVDPQVQAIWAALRLDYALKYINQPPTYTKDSQRIRPPSAVVSERRGTCIDLALLLASCLEQADIYPVIFLLSGHAMPGYWRNPRKRKEFILGLIPGAGSGSIYTPRPSGGTGAGKKAEWYFDRSYDDLIRFYVQTGELVAIESTGLARDWGFGRAQREGIEKILNTTDPKLESMMDVRLAREKGVTPLPMTREIH